MFLILLGAPGAGKGTVAKKLLQVAPAAHISTGDILRGHVAAGSELGKQAKAFMDAGGLVPDSLILDMMKDRLAQPDAQRGFVLDGFPRTVPQAEGLDKILVDLGLKLTGVINIEVPDEVVLDRILSRRTCSNPACQAIYNVKFMPPKVEGICDRCGSQLIVRADETEEVVRNRLRVYQENTAPLIGYYEKKGQLYRFPGEKSETIVNGVTELLIAQKKEAAPPVEPTLVAAPEPPPEPKPTPPPPVPKPAAPKPAPKPAAPKPAPRKPALANPKPKAKKVKPAKKAAPKKPKAKKVVKKAVAKKARAKKVVAKKPKTKKVLKKVVAKKAKAKKVAPKKPKAKKVVKKVVAKKAKAKKIVAKKPKAKKVVKKVIAKKAKARKPAAKKSKKAKGKK